MSAKKEQFDWRETIRQEETEKELSSPNPKDPSMPPSPTQNMVEKIRTLCDTAEELDSHFFDSKSGDHWWEFESDEEKEEALTIVKQIWEMLEHESWGEVLDTVTLAIVQEYNDLRTFYEGEDIAAVDTGDVTDRKVSQLLEALMRKKDLFVNMAG